MSKIEFNDRYAQAGAYQNLGIVAQGQGRWAEAEKNYREALRIKVEFNDRYAQASTYGQLGRLAAGQGQWAEAEKDLLEALRIYTHFQDQHSFAITLRNLARIASQCHGLAGKVAEILGVTAEEAQGMLDGSEPDAEAPGADAAATG